MSGLIYAKYVDAAGVTHFVQITCDAGGNLAATASALASDGTVVYPSSWARRGPAGVNDPGFVYDASGNLTDEIMGDSADPAACTVFFQKTLSWNADGSLKTESGWVRI